MLLRGAGGKCRGVIPDAINDIFSRIEASKDSAITVRVSFVEIHKVGTAANDACVVSTRMCGVGPYRMHILYAG